MSEREEARATAEAADWFARMRGGDQVQFQSALDAWRHANPLNDAAFARLTRRWDQTAFLKASPVGRGRDLARAQIWSRRPTARYAVAAATLVVVGIAGALTIGRPDHSVSATDGQQFATTTGQLRKITLADGSQVTLDTNSAISVRVSKAERRVRLIRGRARFAVASGSNATFFVDADQAFVTARPGEFDIGIAGPFMKVVLWRGELDLTRTASAAPGPQWRRLTAGYQIACSPAGGFTMAGPAIAGERGWTAGMLSFDSTRLAEAIATLNNYNRTRTIITSPELADLRISGAFRATDPHGFARAVAAMFDLQTGRAPDGTIVLGRGKKSIG